MDYISWNDFLVFYLWLPVFQLIGIVFSGLIFQVENDIKEKKFLCKIVIVYLDKILMFLQAICFVHPLEDWHFLHVCEMVSRDNTVSVWTFCKRKSFRKSDEYGNREADIGAEENSK